MTVEAIFSDGVFRPTGPVTLKEGTKVRLQVAVGSAPDPREAARILAELSARSLPQPAPEDAGRRHDQILYGGSEGAR